ncbi:MAG: DUF6152 family protein [Gammaproteobacteria bacterium]|nr:DUF6152 family protein [Gammaproteobacteria bacterium]
MTNKLKLGLTACLFAGSAAAHHSFAVHYDGERVVTVAGVVEEFRFRNPHGMITLRASEEGGEVVVWKIETNSPNILRRRGWMPESIAAGDEVTIEGFPSRDGSASMRVYRVQFSDGRELIGQRPAAGIER